MKQVLLKAILSHMEDREMIRDSQHGFTKRKSCPTNPVAFCDGVTTSVDKGKVVDVICLDSCKVFNMVPNNILLSELGRSVFDRWTVRWLRKRLEGHAERVVVKDSMSRWRPVMSGVPQGSMLGLVFLNVFINGIVRPSAPSASLQMTPS